MWKDLSTGKRITFILVALALVAVASDFLRSRSQDEPTRISSGFFLKSADIAAVDYVHISKGNDQVELRKKDAHWVVSSADGVPADAQRVTDLLDHLQRAPVEVRGKIAEGDDTVYGLAPAANPTKIDVGSGDKSKVSLLIGKSPTSGGTFIEEQSTKKLVVAKESISAGAKPEEWEYKLLVKLKPNAIKDIQFTPILKGKEQKPLLVSRGKPEDSLVLQDKVKGSEKPNENAVKEFSRMMDQVYFEKLTPRTTEVQKTLQNLSRTEVTLFSGGKYEIEVWATEEIKGQPRQHYLEIKHMPSGAAKPAEAEYEFPELDAALSKWYFAVSSSQAKAFSKKREDVIAK